MDVVFDAYNAFIGHWVWSYVIFGWMVFTALSTGHWIGEALARLVYRTVASMYERT